MCRSAILQAQLTGPRLAAGSRTRRNDLTYSLVNYRRELSPARLRKGNLALHLHKCVPIKGRTYLVCRPHPPEFLREGRQLSRRLSAVPQCVRLASPRQSTPQHGSDTPLRREVRPRPPSFFVWPSKASLERVECLSPLYNRARSAEQFLLQCLQLLIGVGEWHHLRILHLALDLLVCRGEFELLDHSRK